MGTEQRAFMETRLVTSTGYGNVICDKYWLWEHDLWQILVMGTWFVTNTGYGNMICDKHWLWKHDLWQTLVMGTGQLQLCNLLSVKEVTTIVHLTHWRAMLHQLLLLVRVQNCDMQQLLHNNNNKMSCHLLPAPLLLVHSCNRNNTHSYGVTELNVSNQPVTRPSTCIDARAHLLCQWCLWAAHRSEGWAGHRNLNRVTWGKRVHLRHPPLLRCGLQLTDIMLFISSQHNDSFNK
jgi:hypothetical protein